MEKANFFLCPLISSSSKWRFAAPSSSITLFLIFIQRSLLLLCCCTLFHVDVSPIFTAAKQHAHTKCRCCFCCYIYIPSIYIIILALRALDKLLSISTAFRIKLQHNDGTLICIYYKKHFISFFFSI